MLSLAIAVVPVTARGDDADLDKRVQAVLAAPGDAVQAGVWFGNPSGAPIYQLAADRAMPAASVVKTAILIELFAAHAGHLDDPLGAAADAILADDRHPAMAPFSAAQRKEIRAALQGATVRTVGAIMMGSKTASNAVYNAAANLVIAALGGPSDTTAKIRARDPAFGGVTVGRYMLASRAANDNAATPASLAAVLASIATTKIPGVDATTVDAMAQVMMQARDAALGGQRHKEGNLDSDPMACIKTGFYVRGSGKPPLIYVVGAALSGKPTGSRDAAHNRLDKLTDAILAVLRAATR
jgi:ribosomal protein L30E